MPSRIFISYRRDDAPGEAGWLAEHVYRRFGRDRVFLDIDTLDLGIDFPTALHEALRQSAAVLVVIGPRWLNIRDAAGNRRLDNPGDFVRLEVETALGQKIPVVPVLVQGAQIPREEELPSPIRPLVKRQAAVLDHAEFQDDAERLCDRLASVIGDDKPTVWPLVRRWLPVAAIGILAIGLAVYFALRPARGEQRTVAPETAPVVDEAAQQRQQAEFLVAEALAQRRRNQFVEALATLARASDLDPESASVRQVREDVAMDWIRNVRVEGGKSSFENAVKPALAVIDSSLASASGTRRADLLAHTGWATFLLWRDGDRQLNPSDTYREALAIDPANPYANAMLAHWILFQDDDVRRAVQLFETALQSGRATDAVRSLQWSAYGNVRTPDAHAESIRLADAVRREGQPVTARQAQSLWAPYYSALPSNAGAARQKILDALPPDDHISTLNWAFDEYAARDESRQRTLRYYVALLHARAGRGDQAVAELRLLDKELSGSAGTLRDAVQRALGELQPRGRGKVSASPPLAPSHHCRVADAAERQLRSTCGRTRPIREQTPPSARLVTAGRIAVSGEGPAGPRLVIG